MARTHYEILGVGRHATGAEIRSAYRKLALKYHPDRSKDPKTTELFMRVVEAYEVLIDAERRGNYDTVLALDAERSRKAQERKQQEAFHKGTFRPPQAPQTKTSISSDLARLTALFSRGSYVEAEKLAQQVMKTDPREAIPYAVMGDIARARGELNHAANMYAHAVQMDPRNPLYQQRHEELLGTPIYTMRNEQNRQNARVGSLGVGLFMTILACIYIVLAKETPLFPQVGLISTWTLGLVVMLFLSGVVVGVSMTLGHMLDRFSSTATTSLGGVSPTVALASVAVVNFWAAAGLYFILGATQRSMSYSTTRLILAVAFVVTLASLAAGLSEFMHPFQVFLWGGNLTYIGALCGWMVTDSIRR